MSLIVEAAFSEIIFFNVDIYVKTNGKIRKNFRNSNNILILDLILLCICFAY